MAKANQAKKALEETKNAVDANIKELAKVAEDPRVDDDIRDEASRDLTVLERVKDKLQSGYSWTRSALKNLGRRLRNFIHACWSWVKRAFNAIVKAIAKALNFLINAVKKIFNAIADIADRAFRTVLPSAEDKAEAQLEDLNEAAVAAATE